MEQIVTEKRGIGGEDSGEMTHPPDAFERQKKHPPGMASEEKERRRWRTPRDYA